MHCRSFSILPPHLSTFLYTPLHLLLYIYHPFLITFYTFLTLHISPSMAPLKPSGKLMKLVMAKLSNGAKGIERRKGVTPPQLARIQEGFEVLFMQNPGPSPWQRNDRESYFDFLADIHQVCGLALVALCAGVLGRSVVRTYRTEVRLGTSEAIMSRKGTMKCQVLEDIAAQEFERLTGMPAPAPIPHPGIEQVLLPGPQNTGQPQVTEAGFTQRDNPDWLCPLARTQSSKTCALHKV